MRYVPLTEFAPNATEIVDGLKPGEQIVITRDGHEVARVTGSEQDRMARQREAVEAALALREELRAKGVQVSQKEITAWKNEGRR